MFCGIKSNDSPVCSFKLHIGLQQKPDSLHPLVLPYLVELPKWWVKLKLCEILPKWPDRCHFRLSFGTLPRCPMDSTELPHRILLFGCYVIDYKWMVLPLAREPGWPPKVRDLLGQYDTIYQLITIYIYMYIHILAMLCLHDLWSWSTGHWSYFYVLMIYIKRSNDLFIDGHNDVHVPRSWFPIRRGDQRMLTIYDHTCVYVCIYMVSEVMIWLCSLLVFYGPLGLWTVEVIAILKQGVVRLIKAPHAFDSPSDSPSLHLCI